jgi:hypothetical protein
MARKRSAAPTEPHPVKDTIVPLRFIDFTHTDWRGDAEGWLLLYDPAVVGKREFDQLLGMQFIAPGALGWMAGQQMGYPVVASPEHWCLRDREKMADKVTLVVRLGWMQALAVLPFRIAWNGADVRVRSGGLTGEERKIHTQYQRSKQRGRIMEPLTTWIASTKGRLALTWDFMLGFTSKQKETMFGPGHSVEFAWPKGEYKVNGWSFECVEDEDGNFFDPFVLQLATLTSNGDDEDDE